MIFDILSSYKHLPTKCNYTVYLTRMTTASHKILNNMNNLLECTMFLEQKGNVTFSKS